MKKKPAKQSNKRGKSYRDEAAIKRFGTRMKEIREEKNITQEELVRRTSFDLRQIGRMERGESDSGISHIVKVAKGLEVEPHEMFMPTTPKSEGHSKK